MANFYKSSFHISLLLGFRVFIFLLERSLASESPRADDSMISIAVPKHPRPHISDISDSRLASHTPSVSVIKPGLRKRRIVPLSQGEAKLTITGGHVDATLPASTKILVVEDEPRLLAQAGKVAPRGGLRRGYGVRCEEAF
jgi:hypothetical protein